MGQAIQRAPDGTNLSISRDGRYVVVVAPGFPGTVDVWRRAQDGRFHLYELLSGDGTFAQTPPDPGDVFLIELATPLSTQKQIFDLAPVTPELLAEDELGRPATAGDVYPSRSLNAIGNLGVEVYDFPSNTLVATFEAPPDSPDLVGLSGVKFNSSGTRLLVSGRHGRSQLYDTETWSLVDDDVLAYQDIALGYWNAEGSLLATAAADGRISIRDGNTFKIIRSMTGSAGTANSWNDGALLFSKDDSLLLTNFDGAGRLWDVASGEQIGIDFSTVRGTNSGANYGETLQLITAGETSALVWNLDVEAWPAIACQSAGSNLTPDEWAQWGPRDEAYHAICEQFPLPAT